MTELLENNENTDSTIKNVSIDLGSTDFSKFTGEKSFGVDELNAITSDLVTKGVLKFAESCKPVLAESGDMVTINTGIIVFDSGAKLKVEEAISFDLIPNTYIYAFNDIVNNMAEIVVSESLPEIIPTKSDYVLLAKVDEKGNMIDKRLFSSMKVCLNSMPPDPIVVTAKFRLEKWGDSEYIEMGTENFSFVQHFHKTYATCYGCVSFLADNEQRTHLQADDRFLVEKTGTGILIKSDGDVIDGEYTFRVF